MRGVIVLALVSSLSACDSSLDPGLIAAGSEKAETDASDCDLVGPDPVPEVCACGDLVIDVSRSSAGALMFNAAVYPWGPVEHAERECSGEMSGGDVVAQDAFAADGSSTTWNLDSSAWGGYTLSVIGMGSSGAGVVSRSFFSVGGREDPSVATIE